MQGKEADTLRSFLEGLSREDRLVLLMHYADGLTPGEIGAVLGAAEIRIVSSLARLRATAMRLVGASAAAGPPAVPAVPAVPAL